MKALVQVARQLVCCVLLLQVGVALSATPQELIKENVEKSLPQYKIDSIELHDASGLYLVQLHDGPLLHATKDGQYFLLGDLYRFNNEQGVVNESEQTRLAQVEALPEDQMIIFPATGEEKAHISVFTDITCGYCRMLHSEIQQINDLGITVRYLAYPRAGIGSEPYNQMVNIWCSDDPKKWLTDAKLGQKVPDNKCTNPVAAEFNLGKSIGVRGTPSIVLSTGKMIPGYLPADQLAKELGL